MSFRPVGAALGELLREWLADPESRRIVLERTWERALGEAVSRRCRPLRFNDGVLTVEVTDADWRRELVAMSASLIGKMNAALGQRLITRIEWVDEAGEAAVRPRGPR